MITELPARTRAMSAEREFFASETLLRRMRLD
jgi:hypothetical protein